MQHLKQSLVFSLLFVLLALISGCDSSVTSDGDEDIQNPDGDFNTDGDIDDNQPDGDDDIFDIEDEVDEDCECVVRCFSVDNNEIDFGSVPINTCGYKKLVITSSGQSTIHVYNVAIINSQSSSAFEIDSYTDEPPTDLLREHFIEVEISYCPTVAGKDEGVIRISTDSDCKSTRDIKLTSSDKGQAILNVSTEEVDWGTIVKDNQTHYMPLTISSQPVPETATQDLTITDISLGQQNDLFFLNEGNGCVVPFTIGANKSVDCSIGFKASGEGDFVNSLQITANDNVTDDQIKTISLSARSEYGLLEIDRQSIDFGHILVNQGVATESVTVTNNGSGEIDIKALRWLENTNDKFDVDDDNDPLFEDTLPGNSNTTFDVVIEPTVTGSFIGRFLIESEDPYDYSEEIVVSAIAVTSCPTGQQPDPQNPVRCVTKCTPGENVCGFQLVEIDGQNVGRWGYAKCQSDGVTLGDFTPCSSTEVCDEGKCKPRPCSPGETMCDTTYYQRTCDQNGLWGDPVLCVTENECKPVECTSTFCKEHIAPENTECDDGDKCTENGKCNASGVCISEDKNCDEGNICIKYSCDSNIGCVKSPDDYKTCSDNNSCTEDDYCLAGQCIPGTLKKCSDGEDCTEDICNTTTGLCENPNKADNTACSDNDVCSLGDYCLSGKCIKGPNENKCDDREPCQSGYCHNPGGCTYSDNDYVPCDDGNNCTKNDKCDHGSCQPGTLTICEDNNACTNNDCYTDGTCKFSYVPDGTSCSDSNQCTGVTGDGYTLDHCESGSCIPGSDVVCSDDGNPCTKIECNPLTGGCTTSYNNGAECSDNNACTEGDYCLNGTCEPGTLKTCSDGKECTEDICNTTTGLCEYPDKADDTTCSDSNMCTVGDHCVSGECVSGTSEYTCPEDTNQCTDAVCENNACKQVISVGKSCTSTDLCKVNTTCNVNGQCTGGETKDCDDGNPCTYNYCSNGCKVTYIDNSCENPDPCIDGGQCNNGVCTGGTVVTDSDCEDGNPCTTNWCDPVQGCTSSDNNNSCDYGNECSLDDYCSGGSCQPGPNRKDCNDNNQCTDDSCPLDIGHCVNASRYGLTCDDGNPCTENDICNSQNNCISGAAKNCEEGNLCTTDSCNTTTGECEHANITTSPGSGGCIEGDYCVYGSTDDQYCDNGTCIYQAPDCDDGEECTYDRCNSTTRECQHDKLDSVSCDDENPCTYSDTCNVGECKGVAVACDDGNDCTDDICNNLDWSHNCDDNEDCTEEGSFCENGQCVGMACKSTINNANSCDEWCLTNDHCNAGICVGDARSDCQGQCYSGCDEETDSCVPLPNGTTCNDGQSNTYEDLCQDGLCIGTEYFTEPGSCPGHSDMMKLVNTNICMDKWENEICLTTDSSNCKGKGSDDYWLCFDKYGTDLTCPTFAGGKPKAYSRANREPSRYMTYDQAIKACENAGKRLCSALEWEYSCKQNDGRTYTWGSTWDDTTKLYCNGSDYGDANGGQTVRNTGSFANCTNDWIVFDMSGNVSEWTSTLGDTQSQRIRAGGNYGSGQADMTCGKQVSHEWDNRKNYIGFRCCLEID